MKRHLWIVIVSALGVTGVVGCTHCGNHQPLFPNAPWNKGCGCKTTPRPGPTAIGLAPGAPVPLSPEAGVAPPPGGTLVPGPAAPGPSGPLPGTGAIPQAPSPSAPLGISSYGPVPDTTWHAPITNGGVRMAIPETAPPREPVRLNTIEPPISSPPKPAVSESRSAEPPPAPIDVPPFSPVYEQVTSGLRPSNRAGLDWLKTNNYRAVIYLRRATDDESSDRREIESRSLKYMSVEVSPENLRMALDQFNLMVNDSANYPLFVYSRDAMIAGTMWYLHFRTVDHMTDETARAKAVRLGLQEEQTEANRALWLAIQKTLEPAK
jgi:hypothetical protein